MPDLFALAKEYIFQRRIFRFFIVAFIATVMNYLFFFILFQFFRVDYRLSSGIGFFSGVLLGYYLNNKWTFKPEKRSKRRIVKYYLVYTVSLCISIFCLEIFVKDYHVDARLANLLCIMITFCTNYIGTRFWVFNQKEAVETSPED
jgi:putative flippase GtrA